MALPCLSQTSATSVKETAAVQRTGVPTAPPERSSDGGRRPGAGAGAGVGAGVGAGAGVGVGAGGTGTPTGSPMTPVVGLRVELTPPSWPRLYAGASWVTSSTSAFAPGEFAVSIAGGSLGLCPLVARTGSLDLALCAGVFAGTLTAEGRGFPTNRAETRPYLALEAAPTARWNLSRHVDLSATVEALVPLVRDQLVVAGVGEAFQPSAIGLRATIGVGLHFE